MEVVNVTLRPSFRQEGAPVQIAQEGPTFCWSRNLMDMAVICCAHRHSSCRAQLGVARCIKTCVPTATYGPADPAVQSPSDCCTARTYTTRVHTCARRNITEARNIHVSDSGTARHICVCVCVCVVWECGVCVCGVRVWCVCELFEWEQLVIRSALVWDVMRHRVAVIYLRFGATCRPHLQGSKSPRIMGNNKPERLQFRDKTSGYSCCCSNCLREAEQYTSNPTPLKRRVRRFCGFTS